MREAMRGLGLPSPMPSDRWGPRLLFGGRTGVTIDASRMWWLRQDAAGTMPVTAAGQPVGLMLDQSGGASNASQATSAARPTLVRMPATGRRNLLTRTDNLTHAAWVKAGGVTVAAAGQLGSAPAFALTDAVSDWAYIAHALSLTGPAATTAQIRVAKNPSATSLASMRLRIATSGGAQYCGVHCDPRTGAARGDFGGWTYGRTAFAAVDGGDHWLMSVSCNLPSGDQIIALDVYPAHYNFAEQGGAATTGANTFAAPQVEIGASATAYQRVADTADVTEAGVPDTWRLSMDGVDDRMLTPAIPLASDEVTLVMAAALPATGTQYGVLRMADAGGTIGMVKAANNQLRFHAGASSVPVVAPATPVSGAPEVWTMQAKISASQITIRRNGGQVAISTASQGNGQYPTGALEIGSWADGQWGPVSLYGLMMINRLLDAAEIARAERWAAAKCGVSL